MYCLTWEQQTASTNHLEHVLDACFAEISEKKEGELGWYRWDVSFVSGLYRSLPVEFCRNVKPMNPGNYLMPLFSRSVLCLYHYLNVLLGNDVCFHLKKKPGKFFSIWISCVLLSTTKTSLWGTGEEAGVGDLAVLCWYGRKNCLGMKCLQFQCLSNTKYIILYKIEIVYI